MILVMQFQNEFSACMQLENDYPEVSSIKFSLKIVCMPNIFIPSATIEIDETRGDY